MPSEPHEDLLRRIEGEYLEMPGLQLTPEQAQRLWALDRETCAMILEILVARQFLIRGSDDRYRRVGESDSPGAPKRMAKADLVLRALRRYQN
jgi:hypothetical protein